MLAVSNQSSGKASNLSELYVQCYMAHYGVKVSSTSDMPTVVRDYLSRYPITLGEHFFRFVRSTPQNSLAQLAFELGGAEASVVKTTMVPANTITSNAIQANTILMDVAVANATNAAANAATMVRAITARAVIATAATEFANQSSVERVMSIYTVPDVVKVREYLARYPFLVALLIDASFAIGKHFPEVETELHVINDPEISNSERLYALILAPGSYRDTKEAAHNFEHGWWFIAMDRAQDKLSIDLI